MFESHYASTVDKVRAVQLQNDLNFSMGHELGIDHSATRTMRDYRTGARL